MELEKLDERQISWCAGVLFAHIYTCTLMCMCTNTQKQEFMELIKL